MKLLYKSILAFATLGCVVIQAMAAADPFNWEDISSLLVFGDSYSYVQGTYGIQNFSFIGSALEGNFSFTPQQLLSNKIEQNFYGTSAGGPIWAEYLTGCAVRDGEWLPLSQCRPSSSSSGGGGGGGTRGGRGSHSHVRQLWDFAFAGADYSSEFLPPHHDFTLQMRNQTEQYLEWADPVLRSRRHGLDGGNTLVAVWIGINDVTDAADVVDVDVDDDAYPSSSSSSYASLFDSITSTLFSESISSLIAAQAGGYRNFLFINNPPRDRSPGNVNNTNPNPSAETVRLWNEALERNHDLFFKGKDNVVNSFIYDAHSFFTEVLDNYEAYGFGNVTNFCEEGYLNETVLTDPGAFGCAPIESYFWFNSGHVTSHVHQLLAEDMRKFLERASVG